MQFQKDRMNDMLKQADDMATMINVMQRKYDVMQQMNDMTHRMVGKTHDLQAIIERIAGSHCGFRRFLAADPQLLLLGAALLQYSHLLVVQIHI